MTLHGLRDRWVLVQLLDKCHKARAKPIGNEAIQKPFFSYCVKGFVLIKGKHPDWSLNAFLIHSVQQEMQHDNDVVH